jgi:putative FmdB family regulatory protein
LSKKLKPIYKRPIIKEYSKRRHKIPTYDYECSDCGYGFEAFHAMSDEPLVDCPRCDQPKLVKLISPGAAVIVPGTTTPCRGSRTKKRDKLGEGKNKSGKPFWRDGPVNKKVLKNPERYIKEGNVE